MATYIENAMLECISRHYLIQYGSAPDKTVAIVGEKKVRIEKGSFPWQLIKETGLTKKNVTVFTDRKKFKAEYAKDFDLLVGVRPCDGETEILNGAARYKKKFILMPCNCGRVVIKIPALVRKHLVIKNVEAIPGRYNDGTYASTAWMILYN